MTCMSYREAGEELQEDRNEFSEVCRSIAFYVGDSEAFTYRSFGSLLSMKTDER